MSQLTSQIPLPLRDGSVVSVVYAIVDAADYPWASQYKWGLDAYGYVMRLDVENRAKRLHRELLAPPQGVFVNHINGNRLDNRRCNLRLQSASQRRASAAVRCDSKSGYKGVIQHGNRWRARVGQGGQYVDLGLFASKEEAAAAYNKAAKEVYGPFSKPNHMNPNDTPKQKSIEHQEQSTTAQG